MCDLYLCVSYNCIFRITWSVVILVCVDVCVCVHVCVKYLTVMRQMNDETSFWSSFCFKPTVYDQCRCFSTCQRLLVCVCVHACMCMHAYMCVCVCMYMYACACMHVCVCVCVCAHMHWNTYICTCTNAQFTFKHLNLVHDNVIYEFFKLLSSWKAFSL